MELIECCGNCRYAHRYTDEPGSAQCRRFPPNVVFDAGEGYFQNSYPIVGIEHWCGEFKEVE